MSFMKFLKVSLVTVLAVALTSCSTENNNEDGTSFLATAWFSDFTAEFPIGNLTVPITLSGSDGQAPVTAVLALQSRLSEQFLTVNRVECSYSASAADQSLIIPNRTNPTGLVLGGTDGLDSGTSNSGLAEVTVIDPEIFGFLRANAGLLPRLPFNVLASCAAIGVSQAGDIFTSNSLPISVTLVEPAPVAPVLPITDGTTLFPPSSSDGIEGSETTVGGGTL